MKRLRWHIIDDQAEIDTYFDGQRRILEHPRYPFKFIPKDGKIEILLKYDECVFLTKDEKIANFAINRNQDLFFTFGLYRGQLEMELEEAWVCETWPES